jgi:exopolysaccharide biosynthesis operon protein EpsL
MLRAMQKKIDFGRFGPRCAVIPRTFQRHPLRAGAALMALTLAAPAMAQISDTIHPYVSASYNHDSNLLRQSDNAGGDLSDNYKAGEAGVKIERPIGRQILTADLKVSRVTFDRYEQLNYNGKEFTGALEWHLANHLQGHFGALHSETLAPFSDSHSEERNLRTQRRYYFDGTWTFHPSWQVRGSWAREHNDFELDIQRYNNRVEDTSEVGVDYLASSNSRVGLIARRLKGTYTARETLVGSLLDSGYTQDEFKANIFWYFSAQSQIQFLGGVARRQHEIFTQRDENGVNARAIYYWLPRTKLHVNTKAWREFAAVDGTVLNSALLTGGSVDLTYDATSKIGATASAKTERRRFTPIPGMDLGGGSLNDSTRYYTLGVVYAPLQRVTLGLNAFRTSRSGSAAVGTNSYKANGVSFNVNAQF